MTSVDRIVFRVDAEAKTRVTGARDAKSGAVLEQQHALGRKNSRYKGLQLGKSLVYLRKITLFRQEVLETLWMLLEKTCG